MAKVKEITVEVSYLKALPNYENIRVTAGMAVTLEDGDNPSETYAKAWDMVGNEISEQLKEFSPKKRVNKGLI